jgi:ABC-type nitrate/sulfonate/bicarbonate transport system permease component
MSAVGLASFLLLWEGIAQSGWMAAHLLPPPSTLPATLMSEIRLGIWQEMVWASLSHYTAGFFLGSFLGVTLGVSVALFPRVEASRHGLRAFFGRFHRWPGYL